MNVYVVVCIYSFDHLAMLNYPTDKCLYIKQIVIQMFVLNIFSINAFLREKNKLIFTLVFFIRLYILWIIDGDFGYLKKLKNLENDVTRMNITYQNTKTIFRKCI